jgi:hypothetical protein
MKLINKLNFNDKRHYVLAVVLAIFIVMDIKIPSNVASLVDTIVGKTLVIMAGLSLMVVNPLVGILGAIAAYELIRRSSSSTNLFGSVSDFLPSEDKKHHEMQVYQNNSITVEEEIIANMLPRTAADALDSAKYKPIQDKLHAAAKI